MNCRWEQRICQTKRVGHLEHPTPLQSLLCWHWHQRINRNVWDKPKSKWWLTARIAKSCVCVVVSTLLCKLNNNNNKPPKCSLTLSLSLSLSLTHTHTISLFLSLPLAQDWELFVTRMVSCVSIRLRFGDSHQDCHQYIWQEQEGILSWYGTNPIRCGANHWIHGWYSSQETQGWRSVSDYTFWSWLGFLWRESSLCCPSLLLLTYLQYFILSCPFNNLCAGWLPKFVEDPTREFCN